MILHKTKNYEECSCIVPFYNEDAKTVAGVLSSLSKVPNIKKIVCVDDGSEDKTIGKSLKKQFKEVKLVTLKKNHGKGDAIREGLKHASSPYVYLIDSDLIDVKIREIEQCIKYITSIPKIDMIIMRRTKDPWFSKIIRGEILASGERILRKKDLEYIFDKYKPKKYQVEFAINFYMIKKNKKAFWYPCTSYHQVKIRKMGIREGVKKELVMYASLLKYSGIGMLLRSLLFFCRENVKDQKIKPAE